MIAFVTPVSSDSSNFMCSLTPETRIHEKHPHCYIYEQYTLEVGSTTKTNNNRSGVIPFWSITVIPFDVSTRTEILSGYPSLDSRDVWGWMRTTDRTLTTEAMTSFAKVCMDLSNNLRSLRFTRSGSPVPPNRNNSFAKASNVSSSTSKTKTRTGKSNGIVPRGKAGKIVDQATVNHVSPPLPNGDAMFEDRINLTGTTEHHEVRSSTRFRTKYSCSPTVGHRSVAVHASQGRIGDHEDTLIPIRGRSYNTSACASPIFPHHGITVAAIKQRLLNQGLKLDLAVPVKKIPKSRYRNCFRRLTRGCPLTTDDLWQNEKILTNIFALLSGRGLLMICRVCKSWFHLLCKFGFWNRVAITLDIRIVLAHAQEEAMQKSTISDKETHDECAADPVETHLEQRITERLKAAVLRNIQNLTISYLADRCALVFLNSLTKVLRTSYIKTVVKPVNNSFQRPLRLDTQVNHLVTNNKGNFPPTGMTNISPVTEARPPLSDISSAPSIKNSNCLADPLFFSSLKGVSSSNNEAPVSSLQSFPDSPLSSADQERSNVSEQDKTLKAIFTQLILRGCSITDSNLAQIVRLLPGLTTLELQCCNELTELAFWTCLVPTITNLRVFDCINVSDESMGAITQLLPNLRHLTLQAYHVTDSAFSYFSPQQRTTLETVRLIQCMDLTNQAVINLAFALPQLRHLSLSGCTNLTDDGLDVVCENLKQLVELDLSWCAKLTDGVLECIACDLIWLQKLILDRCMTITDVGLDYLSTLSKLHHLSLRWCVNLSDGIIPHLVGMTQLTFLSLAGCKRISEDGLSQLARHPRLRRLELTHCAGATRRVKAYLMENLTECRILD
ncbi:F-box and leucine-rich repeat protein 16 [Clonorchis sinensis]|uniref:F-box and leucine-rich repeat protein 16 n=1 Tax=Clonorchis sinensis TaxID=79923 RepID=G7Y8U0_CLOSI|nr:F-box and leucine-rich repeat protein 16 [Clonorchis sinensis]